MKRFGRGAVAGLSALAVAGAARGGDHAPRELPANAVQPPGASFEKHITPGRRSCSSRTWSGTPSARPAREPVRSAAVVSERLAEPPGRAGRRPVAAIARPVPPGHQAPEAGGPCTPAAADARCSTAGRPIDALLDLIASARCRVDLMIFGWDDDDGRPARRRRPDRAGPGRRARPPDGRPRRLRHRRGERQGRRGAARPSSTPSRPSPTSGVIETPDACFRFDHRKVAVVDDRVVWTGGMILTRPALDRWHNFAFLAEGPIVPQYAALFAERWARAGRRAAPRPARGPPSRAGRPQRGGPDGPDRRRPPLAEGGGLRRRRFGEASHLHRKPLLQRPDPGQEAGRRAAPRGGRPGRPDDAGRRPADEQVRRRSPPTTCSGPGRGSTSTRR